VATDQIHPASPAKLSLSNFFNQRGREQSRNLQSTDRVCIPKKELADLAP